MTSQLRTAPAKPTWKTAGLILCGGRSLRMGRSKADLPFGNGTVLQRVAETVSSATDHLVMVGAPGQSAPNFATAFHYVQDGTAFSGPLAGLISGLQVIQEDVATVFVCGCDSPLLRRGVIHLLLHELRDDRDVVAIDDGIRLQPLLAVYRPAILPIAQRLFATGERSLQTLLRATSLQKLPMEALHSIDPEFDSLRTMNTETEYEEIQARATRPAP